MQLGGEQLAEGAEHLALALEVRLSLPCLPVASRAGALVMKAYNESPTLLEMIDAMVSSGERLV